MGRVDHSEEDRESHFLDIVRAFDAVDGGGPVRTQVLHLIRLHNRMGSIEPLVTDERQEEESGLSKVERFFYPGTRYRYRERMVALSGRNV